MSGTATPVGAQEVPRLEDKTIQPIPADERHGTPKDLFTIWFGSNITILAIVTGGLATTAFGLDIVSAVLGIIIGNLIGGVFMALHSAQGPQLGVAQMIQTRGQFGSYGSLLIVGIVVVMYLGFFAANLVLGGQALSTISPALNVDTGIVIVGLVSVVATIFGYRLIHAYTRMLSIAAGASLLVALIWIVAVNGLPTNFMSTGNFNWYGFMGTVSVAALWQLASAAYVSDYSRYLPQGVGSRLAFWSSYSGCVLGTAFPMILGALVGGVAMAAGIGGSVDLVESLGTQLGPVAIVIIGIFSLGVAASNAMNLYCGVLCTLTIGQTFRPSWQPRAMTRSVTAVIMFSIALTMALAGRENFLYYYQNFLSFLLYALVPWTAINLVDYYLLRHGEYKVEDFFKRDGGIYGKFNIVATVCYVLGTLIQVPFMSTALYTGPIAEMMGGVDISWIVGLFAIAPIYYYTARIFQKTSAYEAPNHPELDNSVV